MSKLKACRGLSDCAEESSWFSYRPTSKPQQVQTAMVEACSTQMKVHKAQQATQSALNFKYKRCSKTHSDQLKSYAGGSSLSFHANYAHA